MRNSILIIFILVSQLTFAVVPPTGETEQFFCGLYSPTLEDIVISTTTNEVFWFNIADNSGIPLVITTELIEETTYYAFESLDPNEISLAINVYFEDFVPAPIGNLEQNYCTDGANTLENLIVTNTSGYSQIFFYVDENQTGEQLPLTTELQDGFIYYAYQGYCGGVEECCMIPLIITVTEEAIIPAPKGELDPFFCYQPGWTLEDVPVFNTEGYSNIIWFADSEQNEALDISTNLENEITYYAAQGEGCVLLFPITIHFNYSIPAPIGGETQTLCLIDGQTLSDLVIFNSIGYNNLFYFDNENIMTANLLSPNTPLENGNTYYITQDVGNCVDVLAITVNLLDSLFLPKIDSDVYFCDDVDTTLEEVLPNVYWFNEPNNLGTALETNSIVLDNTIYYVFSDLSICAETTSITTHLRDCSILNVNEELLNTFTVFPNPTDKNLTIKINDLSSDINIVINDIRGKKVFSKSLDFTENTTNINVSNLEANLYFISLITNKGISTQKFIKK